MNDFELGESWLHPYWWAAEFDEMKEFGEKVLKYYEGPFDKGQIPSEYFYSALYLMGEINRRIRNLEKANKYFDEIRRCQRD